MTVFPPVTCWGKTRPLMSATCSRRAKRLECWGCLWCEIRNLCVFELLIWMFEMQVGYIYEENISPTFDVCSGGLLLNMGMELTHVVPSVGHWNDNFNLAYAPFYASTLFKFNNKHAFINILVVHLKVFLRIPPLGSSADWPETSRRCIFAFPELRNNLSSRWNLLFLLSSGPPVGFTPPVIGGELQWTEALRSKWFKWQLSHQPGENLPKRINTSKLNK